MAGRAEITVGIGGNSAGLNRELSKARGNVHSWAKQVETSVKGMSLNPLTGLLSFLSIRQMVGAVSSLAAAAEKTHDLAKAAGLSTERYLALQDAAKTAGVSVADLGKMLDDYSSGNQILAEIEERLGLVGDAAAEATREFAAQAAAIDQLAAANKRAREIKAGAGEYAQRGVAVTLAAWRYARTGSDEAMKDLLVLSGGDVDAVMKNLKLKTLGVGKNSPREARKQAERLQEAALQEEAQRIKDEDDRLKARDRVQQDIKDRAEQDAEDKEREKRSEAVDKAGERFLDKMVAEAEREMLSAAKQRDRIEQIRVDEAKRMDAITVQAPQASHRLAAIGGYVGGRMSDAGRAQAERAIRVAEEQRDTLKRIEEVLETD